MATFKQAPVPPPEETEESKVGMLERSLEFDPAAFAWVTDNVVVNSPILLTFVIFVLVASFAAFWWQFRQSKNVEPMSARRKSSTEDEFTTNCQWVVDEELSSALPTTAWVCRHCFAEVYLPERERPTRCQQAEAVRRRPRPKAA